MAAPDEAQPAVFTALRDLLNANPCASEFCDETVAELLSLERYIPRRIEVYEVEEARQALINDGAFLA